MDFSGQTRRRSRDKEVPSSIRFCQYSVNGPGTGHSYPQCRNGDLLRRGSDPRKGRTNKDPRSCENGCDPGLFTCWPYRCNLCPETDTQETWSCKGRLLDGGTVSYTSRLSSFRHWTIATQEMLSLLPCESLFVHHLNVENKKLVPEPLNSTLS